LVGGCASFFDTSLRPKSACYDIITDTWSILPPLEQTVEPHNVRVSLTFVGKHHLCAFWVSEKPAVYARMDIRNQEKWDYI
jgi:hypothetical protein